MKKPYLIGFTAVLSVVLCMLYSCQFLDGIGQKLTLSGSISIIPNTGIVAGDLLTADISGIEYKIKPQNYQWYYSLSSPLNLAENPEGTESEEQSEEWIAIEGANEITWTVTSDLIGAFIYVEASDPDFLGSIKSPGIALPAPQEPEPDYISGMVTLAEKDNTFVADPSGVIYGEENSDDLSPSFAWYIDNKGDGNFTRISGAASATLPLLAAYLECNIRVGVSAPPLRGAVYATKLYTETLDKYISGEVDLNITVDYIEAVTTEVIYGEEGNPDGYKPSFTWEKDNNGDRNFSPIPEETDDTLSWHFTYTGCNVRVQVSAPPLRGSVYSQEILWAESTGKVFLMDTGTVELGEFTTLDSCLSILNNRLGEGLIQNYHIMVAGTIYQDPVNLSSSDYPNITAANLSASGGRLVIKGAMGHIKLAARGSLIRLPDNSGLSLLLDGTLALEGLSQADNVDVDGDGLFDGNNAALVYVGEGCTLALNEGVVITGNYNDATNNTGNGGGIYLRTNSFLTVSGAAIRANGASVVGGGIYALDNSTISISGSSEISDNTAMQYGGGIHLRDNCELSISGSTKISGNRTNDYTNANNGGGGIYMRATNSVSVSDNVEISDNSTAMYGGGIFVGANSTLNLSGRTKISGNSADQRGGGIYIAGGTVNMQDNVIIGGDESGDANNSASGGGLCLAYDNNGTGFPAYFNMEGGTIKNNTANSGGGVGFILDTTVAQNQLIIKMKRGTITNNTAGGAQSQIAAQSGDTAFTQRDLFDLYWPAGTTGTITGATGTPPNGEYPGDDTNPDNMPNPTNAGSIVATLTVETDPEE
ncbi:MAG: right-handed parallel beta-helix repeat-containing protein [Spirochaetaceae bacterium]|jgi:hypothetical protein|nr:right-handed parallel beta-helix repeat-containing protein [Spirochaetaceae bacterium]